MRFGYPGVEEERRLELIKGAKDNPLLEEFLSREWAKANQDIFGWSEQGRWQKEPGALWLEEAGDVLGVAIFWQMGGVGYLSQLLVDHRHRGKGLGAKLIQAFEEACPLVHKYALKTYKDSPSQRFYEKLGYRVEAVLTKDVHGIDWVYMAKEGKYEG